MTTVGRPLLIVVDVSALFSFSLYVLWQPVQGKTKKEDL